MKIYTKQGDEGGTVLYDMSKVSKSDLIVDVLGDFDELGSFIGVLIASLSQDRTYKDESKFLRNIQQNLLYIGSMIATPKKKDRLRQLSEEDVQVLEKDIDRMWNECPKLKTFILTGSTPLDCQAHVCRSVARRAERHFWQLVNDKAGAHLQNDKVLQKYINRLSDYFFALARYICLLEKGEEIPSS